MKITSIEAIPIEVPASGLRSALGRFSTFRYGIVVVQTDEGHEGVGEICTLWDGGGPVQVGFVDHVFGPALLGEDPTAINHCLRLMDTLTEAAWPARAGVEMALFDITGKAAGVSVTTLLGGRVRDRIVLSRSVHMGTPEEMGEAAASFTAEGFTCVKVKVGRELAADEAGVAAVREAVGPDVLVRVDANMGWRTTKEAIRAIKALEPHQIHSVEQPIPPGDIRSLVDIRRAVDTPIMADESVWGPGDAWELLRAGAVDLLNVYVAESGGLTNSSLIFRMAELSNVGCLVGAMPELGIGTSAGVHLAAAMTNLHDPCDASGVLYHSVDVIRERFDITDGMITPLSGTGLGVTLDMDAVDQYRMG
jgi:muconate cycloisomerase